MEKIRLNKFLALHEGISRREADNLITRGAVTVNGQAAELGHRITDTDTIKIGDRQLTIGQTAMVYVMLHKPRGYVCSRKQQGDTPTIYNIIPAEYQSLKTVGRLDKDSSGLILLTNDGDFTQNMTHPSHYKIKRYTISTDQPLQPLHQQMISDFGIELPDGKSQLTLERTDDSRKNWIVTMSEGRNRQIRRTFAALGYTVTALHRTDFGPYNLGNLAQGQTQVVTKLS